MGLGNYIFCLIYCCIFIAIYLVLLFKIFHVTKSRKSAALVIIACGLVIGAIEFLSMAPDPEHIGMAEYWVHNVSHLVYTFIMLGVFAYATDEYMPRVLIKIVIYMDVLPNLAYTIYAPVESFIFEKFSIHLSSINIFGAHELIDLWFVIPYIMDLIFVVVIYRLLGKLIDRLLAKVPDVICMLIFLGFVLGLIISIISMGKELISGYDVNLGPLNNLVAWNRVFVSVCCCMLIGIIVQALTNRRYVNNMKVEASMQYEYYRNVVTIHNEVRNIRHDIANHISAMNYSAKASEGKYEASLIGLCSGIRQELGSLRMWSELKSQVLSKREMYVLDQYVRGITSKYCSNANVVDFAVNYEDNCEIITVSVPFIRWFAFRQKSDKAFALMKTIVKNYGGNINWSRGADSLVLSMRLPLDGADAKEREVDHEQ